MSHSHAALSARFCIWISGAADRCLQTHVSAQLLSAYPSVLPHRQQIIRPQAGITYDCNINSSSAFLGGITPRFSVTDTGAVAFN